MCDAELTDSLPNCKKRKRTNIGYTLRRLVLHGHKTLGHLSKEKYGFRLCLINSICGRFGKGNVLRVNLDHEHCRSVGGEFSGTYLESFLKLYGLFLFRGSIHDTIYDSTTIVIFAFVPDN